MTDIVETSTYESAITQLETTDLVLGGANGASNRAIKQLANRTKWLYDRIESLTEHPVASLPYPSINTADCKLTVTPASATAGGTVSVAAGTRITLCEPVVSAETGRLRSYTTSAYTSGDLLVNSTYYLRAQVDSNGDLLLYTQRGADSNSIPASLMGTPDAASAGGFDSTVFDMLVAKVVTSDAESAPTVTALRNEPRLMLTTHYDDTANYVLDAANNYSRVLTVTLNWARVPKSVAHSVSGINTQDIAQQGSYSWLNSATRSAVSVTAFYNEPGTNSPTRTIRFTGHITAIS